MALACLTEESGPDDKGKGCAGIDAKQPGIGKGITGQRLRQAASHSKRSTSGQRRDQTRQSNMTDGHMSRVVLILIGESREVV